jgi:hypothetical protein
MRIHCSRYCLFAVAVILLGLLFSACMEFDIRGERGSGRMTSEQRTFHGISGVNLATIGHMEIRLGNTESLRIEAEDNLMPYIKTEVNHGELIVKNQEHFNLHNTKPINYYLTVKGLESISIFSSGDIEAPDLDSRNFSITIASAGDLRMRDLRADLLKVNIFSAGDVKIGALNANRVEVNISSTGDLDIAGGMVKSQSIMINSTGDYSAKNLESDEADVSLNSTGSATIHVRGHLNANLNSTGELRYVGSPTLNVNKTSIGDVVQIGR